MSISQSIPPGPAGFSGSSKYLRKKYFQSYINAPREQNEDNILNSFWEANISLIPKPNKKMYKKEKSAGFFTHERDLKYPNQNISTLNSTTIFLKKTYHDQVGLTQRK